MFDQKNGIAQPPDLTDKFCQICRFAFVHAGRRLIKHQNFGITCNGTRNLQSPLLSIRKICSVIVRVIRQTCQLQCLFCSLLRLLLRLFISLRMKKCIPQIFLDPRVGADHCVFHDRHMGKQFNILEGSAHPQFSNLERGHTRNVFIVKINLSFGRCILPCDTVEQSRFPGAVWADDPNDLSLVHMHIYRIYGNQAAKPLCHLFCP